MMFLLDLVKDSWIEESLVAVGLCYPPQSDLCLVLSSTSNSIEYFLVLGRVRRVKSTPRRHLWRGTLVSRNLRHYLVDLYWLVSCPLYFDMIIYKYLVLVEFETEKYARRQTGRRTSLTTSGSR